MLSATTFFAGADRGIVRRDLTRRCMPYIFWPQDRMLSLWHLEAGSDAWRATASGRPSPKGKSK